MWRKIRKGFTLIELLLMITIIVIMTALILIAINPAEMARRGRDATRFQDLESIRKAIAILTAQESAELPGDLASPHTGSTLNPAQTRECGDTVNNWLGMDVCTYLPTLPIDPRHGDGSPWAYEFAADGSRYELRSKVESTRNYDRARNDGGNQNTCPGVDCWFEVGTDIGLDLL